MDTTAARSRAQKLDRATAIRIAAVPFILDGMEHALRRGSIGVLRRMLDQKSALILAHGTPNEAEALSRFEVRFREAMALEEVHGAGCLLDLNDETIRASVEKGWVRPNMVRAAERFAKSNQRAQAEP